MKARLMYRDYDFDRERKQSANEPTLTQDLELNTLFRAMAQGDEFLLQVARVAVLSGLQDDCETIFYRQAALKDCLRNETAVREIYNLAFEAIECKRKHWLGVFSRYPGGILYEAVRLLQMQIGMLARLKDMVYERAALFESEAFKTFFEMLKIELADDYFAAVKARLKELEFDDGVLVSAELGAGNQGVHYVLRPPPPPEPGWWRRIFCRDRSGYTFRIDPRDNAGYRALAEIRDEGINLVANAVAQSADHITSFFEMLRTELAFYLGCLNLHHKLVRRGATVCFPIPETTGTRKLRFKELRDACLILSMEREVVGNDLEADTKNLVILTGANQGGKSTLLRGMGLAQLMMQSGMFVTAQTFSADLCRHIFTHYKREEDASMTSGKFDEELARMSDIADALTPDSLLLLNESFAATNEREGSEIARQVVRALLETRVKIFFVTHFYEFARAFWEDNLETAMFLRAERNADGQRSFKLLPGEPLETSFGADLYREIFEHNNQREVLAT